MGDLESEGMDSFLSVGLSSPIVSKGFLKGRSGLLHGEELTNPPPAKND